MKKFGKDNSKLEKEEHTRFNIIYRGQSTEDCCS